MVHYDYIIAGGGAAGLSLALELIESDLSGRTILIVDRETKSQNDHTWCFWTDQPTGLETTLFRSWKQIRFVSSSFDQIIPLENYRYHMLRGIDYYDYARNKIAAYPNCHWIQGAVNAITDTLQGAQVDIDGELFSADFVFDSILKPADINPQPLKYHYLKQHFVGWVIETPEPSFDPQTPILFDFRTPQDGAMRFMYILPFSPNLALVEYTLFSAALLSQSEYRHGLQEYLEKILGIENYEIKEIEQGVIPMTDQIFTRKSGAHILNIGTKGGRVKPSSGYAFWRIHEDSKAIVHSLSTYHHPFFISESSSRYRWFDTILLQIMLRHPNECADLFTILFKKNSIQSIFHFLNEDGSWLNDLKILSSLPPYRFIEALLKVKLLKRV